MDICLIYLEDMNTIESKENLLYQIALTKIEGIGNILAKKLLEEFNDVKNIFKADIKHLSSIRGISKNVANSILDPNNLIKAENEIDFVLRNKIKVLFFNTPEYPSRLLECADAPILLYYKGNVNLNSSKIVSIVGTRKASKYGLSFCEYFLEELSSIYPDIIIISGLAYGIDIQAHNSALQFSLPTIGILAHGLDRIYPSVHRSTASKMIKRGGLISEFSMGTQPDKFNFVQRNRIIAGLADATIVVESDKKGGSLITADIANSYDREVFALPGRITDKESKGCNMLIEQNKAVLLDSVENLLKHMGWYRDNNVVAKNKKKDSILTPALNPEEQIIYDLLNNIDEPIHFNEMSKQTNIPISKLMAILLNMELNNLIINTPGNYYKVKRAIE